MTKRNSRLFTWDGGNNLISKENNYSCKVIMIFNLINCRNFEVGPSSIKCLNFGSDEKDC